jgi:hypothetical protein
MPYVIQLSEATGCKFGELVKYSVKIRKILELGSSRENHQTQISLCALTV